MIKVCEKKKFWTRTKAFMESKRLKNEGKIYADQILYQYYCKECLAWHNSKITEQEYNKKYNESKLERIERLIKESKNNR